MTRGADSDLGTTGNRYCERVGLASVPCVEDVLDRDEVSLFHLMVVALLERGRPMTVEQIAERLTEAGAVARSGDMVLALKRAWHGREPVFRDPRGGLGLNLSSSELDRMMWHAGLRPPRFQPPEPPPEPAQPGDEAPLTENELTAAFHDRSLYGFSAHRQAAAVLDVRLGPMRVDEVEGVLAGMTRYRSPFAADRVRFWRSTLVALDGDGRLTLDRNSPDLGVMRRAVRKLARPVLIQQARHEQWLKLREERDAVLAEERQRQAQEIAHLRRAVIRAVPETEAPGAIALVAIGTRSIRTFVGGELAGVVGVLAEFDVLYGVLHHCVRLRWGFRDEMFPVDWALPEEPSLDETLQGAQEAGVPVDLVVGSAPGRADPWSRARRGSVLKVEPSQVTVRLDDEVRRFDRRDIQAVRLA